MTIQKIVDGFADERGAGNLLALHHLIARNQDYMKPIHRPAMRAVIHTAAETMAAMRKLAATTTPAIAFRQLSLACTMAALATPTASNPIFAKNAGFPAYSIGRTLKRQKPVTIAAVKPTAAARDRNGPTTESGTNGKKPINLRSSGRMAPSSKPMDRICEALTNM